MNKFNRFDQKTFFSDLFVLALINFAESQTEVADWFWAIADLSVYMEVNIVLVC